METKAGLLDIEVRNKKTVFMQQNPPTFSEIVPKEEVSKALHVPIASLGDYPPQVVSTGVRDIIVEVKTLKILRKMKPDFGEISKLSKRFGTIGLHAFSMQTLHGSTVHCRNFAPLYGIPEESETGTANGALACYLQRYKFIDSKKRNLCFEQGYSMNMPSEVLVKLIVDMGKIKKVEVGGTAVLKNVVEI